MCERIEDLILISLFIFRSWIYMYHHTNYKLNRKRSDHECKKWHIQVLVLVLRQLYAKASIWLQIKTPWNCLFLFLNTVYKNNCLKWESYQNVTFAKRHSRHFHELCDAVKFYNSCKLFKFRTFNSNMWKKAASLKRNHRKEFMLKEKFGWVINA